MLPTNLVSTYQAYKKDTDSIAAWLASTAKSCGYASESVAAGPANKTTSTRLKGKARAAARKTNASTTKSAAKSAVIAKYTIKIKDFVPLAEFIASQHNVSIPTSLITTLRRVIAIRGGFGDKLAEEGAIKDKLNDQKHGYFVGILRKVRDVLQPRTKPSKAASTPKRTSEKEDAVATDGFVNQFAALKMYEPSEDFANTPDVERPKPSEGTNVTYEAEPLTSLEDVIIATTMLINDLNVIRSRVEWIWSNWRDGFFDLAAAAIATNTAIDLARNLMDDVVPLIKDCGGLQHILAKVFVMQAITKGYVLPATPRLDDFALEAFDVADGTYILTYNVLESLARVVQAQNIPIYKEGSFGYYDPRSTRESKSGYKKHEEDRVLLMKFFTELMAVERGVANYPVADEFLRGVKELAETKQVSFHLVFAAQIFLDIHHTLRAGADRGYEMLEKNLCFLEGEIDAHLEYHKDMKINNWPAHNNWMISQIKSKLKSVLSDPAHNAKLKAYREIGQPVPISLERNRLLKMSPVLSGLMLYHFRIEVWDVGIALANAWGSITYSLHLYNALQAEELEPRKWPDMDVVRTLLGDSNFFVGDAPGTAADYFKKFCLQMGTTVTAFSKNRRANPTLSSLSSKSGPRGIKDGAPVSSMFMDRYLRNTGQVDWTAADVAKVIELSLWETEGSEEEHTLILGQIEDPEKLRQKKNRKKFSPETAKLHPEQLIRGLMFALQGEVLEIAFPYTAMHRECWSLLRAVRKHCDPLLRQTFDAAYMERESELCFVVGYIFMAITDNPGSELLSEAAVAVREYVRTEGSTMLGLLKEIGMPVEFKSQKEAEEMGLA
ncbi:GTP cyclohydrolase II [Hypoxylon texense]